MDSNVVEIVTSKNGIKITGRNEIDVVKKERYVGM